MSTLAEILQQQISHLEALLQLLERESEALRRADWTTIEVISAQKIQAYREISALESQRAGRSGGSETMQHRKQLLQRIAQRNQQNGASIQALGRFQQDAWQILFDQAKPLYDEAGRLDADKAGHRLGSA